MIISNIVDMMILNKIINKTINKITIKTLVITAYYWSWVVIANIIGLAIIIPGLLLGESQKWARQMIVSIIAEITTGMMKLVGFWSVEYIDKRKLNNSINMSGENYVIVSNHLSFIDTAFTAMLPFDILYTWNKKWAKIPGFGQLCLLAGHIAIDHTSDISKKEALEKSEKALLDGINVLFYPEGTRGKDQTKLLPFKTGAFRVAQKSNVKILPITLIGTREACNGGICDTADIKIVIDDPIKVGTEINDIDMAVNTVRNIMLNNIEYYYSVK